MPIVVTAMIGAMFAVAHKYYARKTLKQLREPKIERNALNSDEE
jgi:hypothetical protein